MPRNKELKNVRTRMATGNPTPGDEARYKELTGNDASNIKRMSGISKELRSVRQRIARGYSRPGDEARYKELSGYDASTIKREPENNELHNLRRRIARGHPKPGDEARYTELTGKDASAIKRWTAEQKERHQKQKNELKEKKRIQDRIRRGAARAGDEERLKDLLQLKNQPSASSAKKRVLDDSLSDSENESTVAIAREYSLRARKKQAFYFDPSDSEREDEEMILDDDDDDDDDDDGNSAPGGDAKMSAAKLSAEGQEGDGSPEEDAKMSAAKLPGREEVRHSSQVAHSVRVNEQDIGLATPRAVSTSVGVTAKSSRVTESHGKAGGGTALLNVAIKQEEGVKQEEGEDAANNPSTESAFAANRCAESAIIPDHTNSLSAEDWQQQNESEMAEEENQPPHLLVGTDGRESHGDDNESITDLALARATARPEAALSRASNVAVPPVVMASCPETFTIRFCRKDLDPEDFIDVDAQISQDSFLQDVFKSDATKDIRKLSKQQKKALADKKKEVVLDYVNELKRDRIYRRYRMQELQTISTLQLFETIPRNQKGNIINGASHPITFHVHLKDNVAALGDESEDEDCYM